MNSTTTTSRGLYYHLQEGPHALTTVVLLTLLAILLMCCTLVGNTLVCLAVILVRKLRSQPANYLLVSLAIADMCVGVFVMPLAFLYLILGTWSFGQFMCDVWTSADVTLCTASILNLCAISVDRYSAITRPLTYGPKRTSRRMLLYVLLVWIAAVFVSFLPPIAFWKPSENGKCAVTENIGYQIYATMASFYIPATIILAVNYKIFKAARRLSLSDRKYGNTTSQSSSFTKNGTQPSPSFTETRDIHNQIRSASDNFKSQDQSCQVLEERKMDFIDFEDDLGISDEEGEKVDRSRAVGRKTGWIGEKFDGKMTRKFSAGGSDYAGKRLGSSAIEKFDGIDRSPVIEIDKSSNIGEGAQAIRNLDHQSISDFTNKKGLINSTEIDCGAKQTTTDNSDQKIITPSDPRIFHEELINLSLKKRRNSDGPISRQNSDKTVQGILISPDHQNTDRSISVPRKQSISWAQNAQNAQESRRLSSPHSNRRLSVQPIDSDHRLSVHSIGYRSPESEGGSRSERSSFSVSYHFEYSISDNYCTQRSSIMAHLRSINQSITDRLSILLDISGFRRQERRLSCQNRHISRLHDHHQPGEFSPKIRVRMVENGNILDKNQTDHMYHHPNHQKNRSPLRRRPRKEHQDKTESRALKTLGLIMGCFLLCWIPFFTVTLIRALFCSPRYCFIPGWLDSLVLWLGYANSTLNPLLYAKYNKDFRIPFREMLCCRCATLQSVLRMEDYLETFGGSMPGNSDDGLQVTGSSSFHRGGSKMSSSGLLAPSPSVGGTFVSSASASTALLSGVTDEGVTRDISL